jgi:hypothetical protein
MPGVVAEHVAYRAQEAADRAAMYDQGRRDIRESLDRHLEEVPAERCNERGVSDEIASRASEDVKEGQYPLACVTDVKPIDGWHIDAYESGMHSGIATWMSEHHQPYGATEMLIERAKTQEVLNAVEQRFVPQQMRSESYMLDKELKLFERTPEQKREALSEAFSHMERVEGRGVVAPAAQPQREMRWSDLHPPAKTQERVPEHSNANQNGMGMSV